MRFHSLALAACLPLTPAFAGLPSHGTFLDFQALLPLLQQFLTAQEPALARPSAPTRFVPEAIHCLNPHSAGSGSSRASSGTNRLQRIAEDVDRIAAKNAARQQQSSLFGLYGVSAAGSTSTSSASTDELVLPSDESSSTSRQASSGNREWFEVMPVDPGLPEYALISSMGMRTHPIYGTRKFHSGHDLSVRQGRTVRAVGSGTVVGASYEPGYGNWILIAHPGGTMSFYAHLQDPAKVVAEDGTAREGAEVIAGDQIGLVGSTGTSTGPHLHFEIWAREAQLSAKEVTRLRSGVYPVDGWTQGFGLRNPSRYVNFRTAGSGSTPVQGPVPAPTKPDAPWPTATETKS